MFKDRLKDLRNLHQLTQKDLAAKLNCSSSKIGMWETGKREPTNDDLILLSNLFEVSTDYLLGIDNNITSNKVIIAAPTNPLVAKIESLTELQQKEIEDFVDFLIYKAKVK